MRYRAEWVLSVLFPADLACNSFKLQPAAAATVPGGKSIACSTERALKWSTGTSTECLNSDNIKLVAAVASTGRLRLEAHGYVATGATSLDHSDLDLLCSFTSTSLVFKYLASIHSTTPFPYPTRVTITKWMRHSPPYTHLTWLLLIILSSPSIHPHLLL